MHLGPYPYYPVLLSRSPLVFFILWNIKMAWHCPGSCEGVVQDIRVTSVIGRHASITLVLRCHHACPHCVTIHPNFHSPSQHYHHHLFSHQPSLSTNHHHQYYPRLESLCRPYYGASIQRRQSQYRNYRTATCPAPVQNQRRNYKTATCLVLVHLQSPVNCQNTQSCHRPPDISSQNHLRCTNALVPLSVVTTLTSSNIQRDLPNLGGSIWHTHRHRSTSEAYHQVALHPLHNARASRMEATSPQTYHPQWSIRIAPRQVRCHRLHPKRRLCRAPQDPPSNPPHLLPDMAAY